MPPIIKLDAVTKHYGDVTAAKDVSLSVAEGEILVLLGSSGCGKTTTLRLVAGLERPASGRIHLDGRPVAGEGAWVQPEERRIGMVFQDYALFPHLSVQQNIEFALNDTPRRQRSTRLKDMLALVGLQGMGSRFPHQLSGGQQQRVALARALASAPSVVLLDEPFSNLDAALRKTMREEVRRILKAAHATAIFVTHDQEEAMSIADSIAVMQAGRVLQVGQPAELYQYPALPEVAAFLGEVNLISGDASGTEAVTPLGRVPLARAANGPAQIMLRPESLRLTPDEEGEAIVRAVRFYGYYQLLDLELVATQETLTARVWAQERYAPGDRVSITVEGTAVAFDPESIANS